VSVCLNTRARWYCRRGSCALVTHSGVMPGPEMGSDGIWYVKTQPSEGAGRFLFMPLNTPAGVPVCRYVARHVWLALVH